jgi:short-subunit dehydrogenase
MNNKSIVIIGATSGIGLETAKIFIKEDYVVGICGRRYKELEQLQRVAPSKIFIKEIDITSEQAPALLLTLIEEMGGTSIILNCAGIGFQNRNLDMATEIKTIETNVLGFTRIVDTAFNYFSERGQGHFAAISSIAGVKGLGAAPAYSATKRYQNTYIQALTQLSHIKGAKITFTDIRPGFVNTALLADNRKYPLLMSPQKVASKIVSAIKGKKRGIIIDWRYAIMVFFWRMIPTPLWERLKITN